MAHLTWPPINEFAREIMSGMSLHDLPDFCFWTVPFRFLTEHCIICVALIAATCLVLCYYKASPRNHSRDIPTPTTSSLESSSPRILPHLSFNNVLTRLRRRPSEPSDITSLNPSPRAKMGYTRRSRSLKKQIGSLPFPQPPLPLRAKQYYDAFLVLDVEATCQQGTDFNFPNEIIEFPVCLMRWKDRTKDLQATQLEVVAEFRSFVKPTWRPVLSKFCTDLTGITQEQVDAAPPFPSVLASVQDFMVEHGLIDGDTGERLVRFCWCSDGPFDIRDFVVKQCFISKVPMPGWIQGDVLDVRTAILNWLHSREQPKDSSVTKYGPRRRTLNITAQLKVLGLSGFEGRQHSGIDDSRNIARIVAELARRGTSLHPNTVIHPNRRWQWMGRHGQILDDHWTVKNVDDTKPWQKL
ncbi:3'-5' exoribonuclease 1 [Termitomyces sp. T112]|nr:3'-5' exoribonuclease 1 [Termitomyces sp. T112]